VPEYRCYLLDDRYYVVPSRTVACEIDDNARVVADSLWDDSTHFAIEVCGTGYYQVYERNKARVP